MLKQVIHYNLSRSEIKELMQFLSYHFNYVPLTTPKVVFAKTAKTFARVYENFKNITQEHIDEINSEIPAFYDHPAQTIVFQGFSYVKGIEIPKFIIPMATVVHEFIHHFQFSTGPYGSYRTLYEGTNDILSAFLTDDYRIDYQIEATRAFNLIMTLTGHDFWEAIRWMKTYTVHSTKNEFTHRSIENCKDLRRNDPKKLMLALDDNNVALKWSWANKYSYSKMVKILKYNRTLIA